MSKGTRNTLTDLNNHLFEQLERLNDEDLKGEQLQEEIMRAKAVGDMATKIVSNASLVLEAQRMFSDVDYGQAAKRAGELSRLFLPEP